MKVRHFAYCGLVLLGSCRDIDQSVTVAEDATGKFVAVTAPAAGRHANITADFKVYETGLPVHNAGLRLDGQRFKSGMGGHVEMRVAPGTYSVRATHPDYRPMSGRKLKVGAGESCRLTIYLIPR